MAFVQGMESQLSAAVRGPLLLAVTLYIAGMTAMELMNPGGDPLLGLFRKIIRASVVLSAASMATYTPWVHNILLNDLPNSITNAISGAAGNGALAPAAFDTLLGQAYATGLMVYKSLSGWSAKSVGISITVGLYLMASAICIGAAFFMFLAAHILLGLTVAFGPMFMCFLLFPRTLRYFDGWLSTALTLVLCQALLVGLLSLLINVETDIIHSILALNGSSGENASDEFGQLHFLVEGFILFASIGFFAGTMPIIAARIMGGAAAEFSPITRVVNGALSSGAAAVGQMAMGSSAPASGGGAQGMRAISIAGRSP
jgi:type IV secretory pathway VirB6-like protein